MIERLFAQQGQARAFLALLLGGLALGTAAHAAALVRRRWRRLSPVMDATVAAVLLAVLLIPALAMDTPLRLYGLLGLTLGAAIYAAGIAPAAEGIIRRVRKSCARRRKSPDEARI